MAQYGEVRVDYITYTTGTAPAEANETVSVSGLVNNPQFDGDVHIGGRLFVGQTITATGNISGEADGGVYGTGYWKVPSGTTAQRPALALAGMMRWNQTLQTYEGYDGNNWGSIGGGATGSGTDQVFLLNEQTVNTDYTIPDAHNATSCGPITIVDSVEVVIGDGENWSIV